MATGVNPDLQRERNKATFDPLLLTYILDGDKEKTERRRYIENLAASDPKLAGPNYHFLNRSEKYSEGVRKAVYMVERTRELGLTNPSDLMHFKTLAIPHESSPMGLHYAMFVPGLYGQASLEQQAQWLPLAMNHEIIGTYAQTELGHGTFIRGLETTATYDPQTEEFVLHSPTLTSAKWWPGNLGKTTNYAIVMAQLYTQGVHRGIQGFVVQTRSLEDHSSMPGVTLGDIGPKFGYDTNDNGFMMLDHVRIPRENMLMKNAQVLKDGTFVKAKNAKLTYGTMVFVRAMIVNDCAHSLAQACTIATRYSAIRHQSEITAGVGEPQILDYQTQQYKLIPLIATSYAFWFAGSFMRNTYFQINSEIQAGNLDLLPELHGLSSGLKAFTSYVASEGVETCRTACGGHGFSAASGLPKIYVDVTPAITYEGENTVMLLQCARYLVKSFARAQAGEKLSGSISYMSESNFSKCLLTEACSLDTLVSAYKHVASRLVKNVAGKLSRLRGQGKSQETSWNLCSVELTKVATAHCHYFIVKNFVETVYKIETHASVKKVLVLLCQLYALDGIYNNAGNFIEDGYMTIAQVEMVKEKVLSLLAELRPNAVALVDSFDFHDRVLDSVLGRYDGNVYENLFKWAQESPLNKTDVHESYYKYLRPMLKGTQSKL